MARLSFSLPGAILLSAGVLGPALAAERPGAPEAARPCPRHGPGFVEVPGTATCVRIGGRVRAEAGTGTRRIAREDIAGLGASGRVSVDTRTDTAYGPVRTFVRLKAGPSTGPR